MTPDQIPAQRERQSCAARAILKPEDFVERTHKTEPMWSWRARAVVAALRAEQVWVLDSVGYDARGSNARVFSTPELAKQAASWVKEWTQDDDGGWSEKCAPGSVNDIEVVYQRTIDAVEETPRDPEIEAPMRFVPGMEAPGRKPGETP